MENGAIYGIYIVQYIYIERERDIYLYDAIFLDPFADCSSCNWKFVVCPFVDEETNKVIRLQTNLTDLPICESWYLSKNV